MSINAALTLLTAALGLTVGSFLNVVIYRLRTEEKGFRSRSACPNCHAVLRAIDLVPVLSFVLLRGKCRDCRKPISWQYPVVEVSVMVMFLAAFFRHGGAEVLTNGQWLALARDAFFILVLTVVFVIDLIDMVVYDSVTIPAALIALVLNVLTGSPLSGLLLAALIGGGFFLLQWLVSRGKWIGGGDVRIGAMMGAMLGLQGVLAALLIAYVVGAIVAVILLANKKTSWSSQMAFGTFLSFATVVVLLWGDRLWALYAGMLL